MIDSKFTSDWFSENYENWEKISAELHQTFGTDLQCLEVGVWEGRSLIYTLDNFVGNGRMYAIDYFKYKGVRTRYYSNIAKNPRYSQVTTLEVPSSIGLAQLLVTRPASFHYIYIDAGKLATSNVCNLVLAESLLVPGGIMTVDDYLWDKAESKKHCPGPGIDAYKNLTLLCDVISEGYQVTFKRNNTVI
jgi:predicted O-methyltransferase YrrM